MTRLDATSELSMEDILASIRKIIAEDPPGSRAAAAPVPAPNLGRSLAQPQQTQQSAALRATARDPLFPDAREPVTVQSVAAEPQLRAEPQRSSPSAAAEADAFFAESSAKPPAAKPAALDPAPVRVEPSFAAMAQPFPAPQAPQAALSVDAQLSDLLGEALPARPVSAASTVPATRFEDIAPSRAESLTAPVTAPGRQGFTISRDGFVPENANAEPAREREAEPDPFDFDLGPSPFEVKGTTAQESSTSSIADTVSLIPTQPAFAAERSPAEPAFSERSPFDLSGIVPARTEEAPAALAAVATPSVEAAAASEPDSTPATATAVRAVTSDAAPESIARFIPDNPIIDVPKPIERDVMEVAPQEPSGSVRAPVEKFDGHVVSEPVATSASVTMTEVTAHQRTMEDTVADLLRPMLRSWLAENMPRIVERALQREISEQFGDDKQEAAE
jgi:cell pole-organizing protein PopZ